LFAFSFLIFVLFSPIVASVHATQTLPLSQTNAPPSIHWILDMYQCLQFEPHMSMEMHPQQWTQYSPEAKWNEDMFRRRQLTRSATASLTRMKLMKVIHNSKNIINKEF
jgi:hypothetical protein